jgi:hypothetical protein
VTRRADDLLSGPRGRRLCAELLVRPDGEVGVPWHWHRAVPDRVEAMADVRAALARTDLAAVTEELVLTALLASVDAARYWQGPDEVDGVLALDGVAEHLTPIAEALVSAPVTRWWAEGLARDSQHVVAWPWDGETVAPSTTGTRSGLVQWRTDTLIADARAARERAADPADEAGGEWWSTPALSRVPVTSRSHPWRAADRPAPVGLLLVEDEMGWQTARSWPAQVPGTARVHEIDGPAAWVALVERFPLDVSATRRGVWWEVSGRDDGWAIPDWPAVADAFDAVHLTVDGYLSTAGRALPVEIDGHPARTLLGGWDPDATWWLTDVLPPLGQPTEWRRRDDEPPRWDVAG